MFILGQILTVISYVVYWVSRFFKTKKQMLLLDIISRIFAIVAFVALKTTNGVVSTLLAIVRNFIGIKIVEKDKKLRVGIFLLCSIIWIIIFMLDFSGLATIFVICCNIINLFGHIVCKEQGVRLFAMIGSGFYASFLFASNNYSGFICEVICFFVILVSYIKYRKVNKV